MKIKKNCYLVRHRAGYSLVEVLVTLVIFGIMSVLLGQSLLTNLTLSAKISNRSQVRSSLDQMLSLIEKDLRNANYIQSVAECGGSFLNPTPTTVLGCSASCKINLEAGQVVWCFDSASKKLTRSLNAITTFTSDPKLVQISKLAFFVNTSGIDIKNNVSKANVLVTLEVEKTYASPNMKYLDILPQVKQISVTTRNYNVQ